MEFWGNKIHVSEDAARMQVNIIRSFPHEKRLKIAEDFLRQGIEGTRNWIRSKHPEFSDLEIRLEFVRLMYYQTGGMKEEHWQHFKTIMEKQIKKDWAKRFRAVMEAKNWTYEEVAKWGRFSSGKVVEATISRGLPSFAKLAVVLFEQSQLNPKEESKHSS